MIMRPLRPFSRRELEYPGSPRANARVRRRSRRARGGGAQPETRLGDWLGLNDDLGLQEALHGLFVARTDISFFMTVRPWSPGHWNR